MAISAAQVKELREKTGAGMMDCKKALTEANGDFEKAIELLRKKGASVAAKRAERTASEGLVLTKTTGDGSKGYILEVNCETDFVAKSDDFVAFAGKVMDKLVEKEPKDIDELMALDYESTPLSELLNEIIGKIGEKIEVSRFEIIESENGLVVDYVHHGSKLGVMVRGDNVADDQKKEFGELLKDAAMQVAAMNPSYVRREEVSKEAIEKEIEIYKEVARKEGKPEKILDRIAEGKLNKFYEEVCLLEQAFIKDNAKTIQGLIDESNKKHSSKAELKLFRRFHLSDESK